MEYRDCGNSGLKLSVLGCGCWAFGGGDYWGKQTQKEVNEVVHQAVELGINYFDTAEVYNNGLSEEALGTAIAGIPRDNIIIGTKIAPSNLYPQKITEHCDGSLKRLKTDYIDLYMIHWPIHPNSIQHFMDNEQAAPPLPKIELAIQVLTTLQSQGKIRHLSVSNFGRNRLQEILDFGVKITANELPYNLLSRAIEYDILPFCREKGVGVIGYMALLQGILADIYPTLNDVPDWQRRTRHFNSNTSRLCRHGERGVEEETEQALRDIRSIAESCNLTMPGIALKWALANKYIDCVLVGTRSDKKLKDNIKIVSEPLADNIVEKLNQATDLLKKKLGTSFDYYESVENDRTV